MMLLPPAPDVCQICGVEHKPLEAHNAHSLYYAVRFKMAHGRDATWADAVAHLPDDMQLLWKAAISKSIDCKWTEPPDGVEPIAEME